MDPSPTPSPDPNRGLADPRLIDFGPDVLPIIPEPDTGTDPDGLDDVDPVQPEQEAAQGLIDPRTEIPGPN